MRSANEEGCASGCARASRNPEGWGGARRRPARGPGGPRRAEVRAAALTAEATVAGRHLDNIAACVLGGLTLVRSTDPIDVVRVPLARPLLVALVTPAVRLESRTARSVLAPTLDR